MMIGFGSSLTLIKWAEHLRPPFEVFYRTQRSAAIKRKNVLEFVREAPNFIKALASALSDARRAGAKIERVEPDHLVSMADIARRAGLTRAAISLYAKGMRAQEFPAPVARVTSESPLWDWYEVARWMCRCGNENVTRQDVLQARMVRHANLLILQNSLADDRFAKRLGLRMFAQSVAD